MTIVITIFVFGLLIFIHELGHYVAARIFHVRVFEFAIGMGPKLIWFESKKTGIVYALRMIPFGGFVSMEGELAEDANAAEALRDMPEPLRDPRLGALATKPAWQRLIVHAAGALQNLLFGFLICMILTCTMTAGGTQIGEFRPVEGETRTSEEQGLMVGDEVIKVGKRHVYIAEQLYYEIVH